MDSPPAACRKRGLYEMRCFYVCKSFFGLPGCGKTTILTKLAYDAVRSRRYKNVFSNVPLSICGVTYLDNSCIGKYILEDGLILIDEASLYADSRDHANFSKGQLCFF